MVGNQIVHMGELIEGRTNHFSLVNEGENTFDIYFNLYVPIAGKTQKQIINIEIQNEFYPGYAIEKRAEFYVARMLSMQYGREITKMEYSKLKKVCSVWINTSPPKYLVNTIYEKKMVPRFIKGKSQKKKREGLMRVVMMNLGKPKECTGILRMLAVILSNELNVQEKKKILEEEYEILIGKKIEEEMKDMCDLADAIEKKGIKKGIEKGQINLLIYLFKEKFGGLKKETMENMKMASQKEIEKLAENFMNIDNEEEIIHLLT